MNILGEVSRRLLDTWKEYDHAGRCSEWKEGNVRMAVDVGSEGNIRVTIYTRSGINMILLTKAELKSLYKLLRKLLEEDEG